MRYHVLATDYDGTLAHDGVVDEATIGALERVVASGRRLVLVSGRELEDLLRVFPRIDLFERVVVENGALLYRPNAREERLLGDPPPPAFVDELARRGVDPLSVGRSIVATWEPNDPVVLEVIRELGLELQVIFNKGAVMVLPAGVNKASGLRAALDELELSAHNVVGVGDAENDHAFLACCEGAVAVSNALPALKDRCDWTTDADHGAGVVELCERLLENDLADLDPRLERHHVVLGSAGRDAPVALPPYGTSALLAGPSGSGKSSLTAGFLERLADHGYQFCLVDPEGDYQNLPAAHMVGDPERAPSPENILDLLGDPTQSAIVNLLALPLDDRPAFFDSLLPRLQELRVRLGRPHWLVVDEAHHLLPFDYEPLPQSLPRELGGLFLVTVHPDAVSPAVLALVDVALAVGDDPAAVFAAFAGEPPEGSDAALEPGEALIWRRADDGAPGRFKVAPPRTEQARHRRKYAQGELGEDKSFYFRGPDGKLNLQASNLVLFLRLGDGVDDETWLHHLREGDYSEWIRTAMKDEDLADEIEEIERRGGSADDTRARMRDVIERAYAI